MDWASFGEVTIGRARRKLSCMALILSYSRALYLEFFFDQSLENFLRAHVRALHSWGGCPRTLLYDNLKSVVLERRGDAIRFHPRLLELAAHYHFAPRPCHVGRANEKGRIERALRFVRESFFAARPFTTLERFNEQAHEWLQQIAHQRPWPQDRSRCVAEVFAEERAKLLALPSHPFDTELMVSIHSKKTLYLRFDLNDYSIPPQAVGKALTLVASDTRVRVLDGTQLVASHRRSYDRGQLVADPAHQQALLAQKRKAWAAAPSDRLTRAAPEAEETSPGGCGKGRVPFPSDSPVAPAAGGLRSRGSQSGPLPSPRASDSTRFSRRLSASEKSSSRSHGTACRSLTTSRTGSSGRSPSSTGRLR